MPRLERVSRTPVLPQLGVNYTLQYVCDALLVPHDYKRSAHIAGTISRVLPNRARFADARNGVSLGGQLSRRAPASETHRFERTRQSRSRTFASNSICRVSPPLH